MKNNSKKAKATALVLSDTVQQSISNSCQTLSDDSSGIYSCLNVDLFCFLMVFRFINISFLVNNEMESGTLPPPTTTGMLLHSNEPIALSDSPMNSYSDIFSSRSSIQTNNKTNKRKLDELVDPSTIEFDSSSSSLKPQKTEQIDIERTLNRTGTCKNLLKIYEVEIYTNF